MGAQEDAIRMFIQNTGADSYNLLTGLGYNPTGSYLTPEGERLLYGSTFTYQGSDASYGSIMGNGSLISNTGLTTGSFQVGGETGYNGSLNINPWHLSIYDNSFGTPSVASGSGAQITIKGTDNGVQVISENSSDNNGSQSAQSGRYTFKTTTEASGTKTNQYFIDGKAVTLVEWRKGAPADVISDAKKAIA